MLDSEWEVGSTFTLVIDLDRKTDGDNTIKRHLNPMKKVYPKIIVQNKKNASRKINQLKISAKVSKKSLKLNKNEVSKISKKSTGKLSKNASKQKKFD